MSGLDADELARRSGSTAERVAELLAHGIVLAGPDGGFEAADIQRVRLVEALERSGISLEDLGRAVSEGHLTFAFVGAIWPEPVGLVHGTTMADLAAEHGMRFEFLRRGREGLGLPSPEPGDPVREDDVLMAPAAGAAVAAGFDEAALARHSRLLGESMRRLAESQVSLFHGSIEEPMLASGMPQAQILEIAAQLGTALAPLTERVLLLLYRRHLEHAIVEDLIEHVESALEQAGVPRRSGSAPPAIAFLDLSGFTRLTEERGDAAAAELTMAFEEVVQEELRAHRGRAVKFLGDGVMLHFPSAEAAVRASLDLVVAIPQAGLPESHVGVHAGPVVVRDGDYFGRTVNIAARISAKAPAGEVVVSADVADACGEEAFAFESLGPAELKGVAHPVELFRAVAQGPRTP